MKGSRLMSPDNLTKLPNELFIKIMPFLTVKEIVRQIFLVSKDIKEKANQKMLWTSLGLGITSYQDLRDIINRIPFGFVSRYDSGMTDDSDTDAKDCVEDFDIAKIIFPNRNPTLLVLKKRILNSRVFLPQKMTLAEYAKNSSIWINESYLIRCKIALDNHWINQNEYDQLTNNISSADQKDDGFSDARDISIIKMLLEASNGWILFKEFGHCIEKLNSSLITSLNEESLLQVIRKKSLTINQALGIEPSLLPIFSNNPLAFEALDQGILTLEDVSSGHPRVNKKYLTFILDKSVLQKISTGIITVDQILKIEPSLLPIFLSNPLAFEVLEQGIFTLEDISFEHPRLNENHLKLILDEFVLENISTGIITVEKIIEIIARCEAEFTDESDEESEKTHSYIVYDYTAGYLKGYIEGTLALLKEKKDESKEHSLIEESKTEKSSRTNESLSQAKYPQQPLTLFQTHLSSLKTSSQEKSSAKQSKKLERGGAYQQLLSEIDDLIQYVGSPQHNTPHP